MSAAEVDPLVGPAAVRATGRGFWKFLSSEGRQPHRPLTRGIFFRLIVVGCYRLSKYGQPQLYTSLKRLTKPLILLRSPDIHMIFQRRLGARNSPDFAAFRYPQPL